MAAYAEHFREKGDWTALADLLEFSFERVRAGGAPVDDLVARLEEIAVVAEKNLGDADRGPRGLAAHRGAAAREHARARGAAGRAAQGEELG